MKEKILSLFKSSGNKKLDPIEIIKLFKKNYTSNDIKNVLDILNDLVNEGEIVSCKKNTFKLVSDEYIKAYIQIVSSGNGYALMEKDDLFIDKVNINDALDGDLVLVESFKRRGKLEGKVRRILVRKLPLCEISIVNDVTLIKPLKEYPLSLNLIENADMFLVDGEIVRITCVKDNGNFLDVKVLSKVGHKNSPDIDTLTVMAELGAPIGFSEETKKEVERIPMEVSENDMNGRVDLTDEVIFTIDGKDTKDIDDAIGLTILDNGNYNLKICIADVTNYVRFNSALFNDAYAKGNSIYMADKVEPMLPIELSNGICSLNPNVKRLCICTSIEYDKNANVVKKEVYKAVIQSRKKMNYDDVNLVFDGKTPEDYKEYEGILNQMLELSKLIKKKKVARGEIEFVSGEIKLVVDSQGKVTDIKKVFGGIGENLIEDFMIASNEAVIELLSEKCDTLPYRIHGIPSGKKMEEFIKFLSAIGCTYNGKIDFDNVSNKDIQKILETFRDDKNFEVINTKLLRSMQKAVYSTANIGHFGLGSKKYTHETSPIRRMCDLLIHYLIKMLICKEDIGVKLSTFLSGLPLACDHISETEKLADECEYAVNDLKIAEYMINHIGEEYTARVDGLGKTGFFVETSNHVSGMVSLDTINDFYTLSDDGLHYYNRKKKIALTLGDVIKVKCITASKETRHVDFMLI